MGRKSASSTRALNGSASGSTPRSDWSESTLRSDEAWNNDKASREGGSPGQNRAYPENQPFETGQVYDDAQSSRDNPWSDRDCPQQSAPSTPSPLNTFLSISLKREFFWINGETTGNADLDESDQDVFLSNVGDNSRDEFSQSGTIQTSNEGSTEGLSSVEGNGIKQAKGSSDLNRTKRRKRDKEATGGREEGS